MKNLNIEEKFIKKKKKERIKKLWTHRTEKFNDSKQKTTKKAHI